MRSLEERLYFIDFVSECAILYHGRRHAFLAKLSKLDPVLSLIFGSAAFASAIADYGTLGAISALVVASYSAVNLSYGFSDCGDKHKNLINEWTAFRKNLIGLSSANEEEIKILERRFEEIHAESPEQLVLLSALCEDEIRIRRGDSPTINAPWGARAASHVFSLGWFNYRVNED